MGGSVGGGLGGSMAGSMGGSMGGRANNLPAQPSTASTAEELMRDYLVGEGIKKAHFRALHPKAPKKTKAGFLKSMFGKKKSEE